MQVPMHIRPRSTEASAPQVLSFNFDYDCIHQLIVIANYNQHTCTQHHSRSS